MYSICVCKFILRKRLGDEVYDRQSTEILHKERITKTDMRDEQAVSGDYSYDIKNCFRHTATKVSMFNSLH